MTTPSGVRRRRPAAGVEQRHDRWASSTDHPAGRSSVTSWPTSRRRTAARCTWSRSAKNNDIIIRPTTYRGTVMWRQKQDVAEKPRVAPSLYFWNPFSLLNKKSSSSYSFFMFLNRLLLRDGHIRCIWMLCIKLIFISCLTMNDIERTLVVTGQRRSVKVEPMNECCIIYGLHRALLYGDSPL